MDFQAFSSLFKDLISRLYDRTAIETHPLAAHFPLPEHAPAHRAEMIQRLILDEIEHLRPEGKEALQSPEWRPYLILHKRYVEGLDPRAIAVSLYIGDRQFRRDHSRALQALSKRIWDGYLQQDQEQTTPPEDQTDFELYAEKLDLHEVVEGVIHLVTRRLESETIRLETELSPTRIEIFTDRILLRQILLSLLNYVLHVRAASTLKLRTQSHPYRAFSLLFEVDEQWSSVQNDEQDMLDFARTLSQRLPAHIEEHYPSQGRSGQAQLQLVFTTAQPKTILVIDDQDTAIKMFQRYLSRTNLEVVGLNNPSLALPTVQQTRPALIILDVMMPRIDGWEVLQALQLDPQTRGIPIIVCSAWGEPELAHSLGAATFLKKPVIQKDLLSTLSRLGIAAE